MIFNKKISVMFLSLLAVVVLALVIEPYEKSTIASTSEDLKPTIILDAGHGGFDGGAVALDGTVEKDINLDITVTLSHFLKANGYRVIMTRKSDTSTDDIEAEGIPARKKSDLKNRLSLMNEYPQGIFVSIHLNKFTTSAASGAQIFYSANADESKFLGQSIRDCIISMLQPENTRVNKQATSKTYLLYNATIPAVIVECGFLSNTADLKLLKNTEYQKKMAFCIFCGINNYFSNNKEI